MYYCSIVLLRCMGNAFDIDIEQNFFVGRCVVFLKEGRSAYMHAKTSVTSDKGEVDISSQ